MDFFSERYSFYRTIATVVGVLWLSYLLLKILKSLAVNFNAFFLAPWGITRINLKKHGPWAVVTGSSEGIGRGYALELAKHGLNVVIISRSEEKLKKVADEIREKYSREVRIITADFSKGLGIYPNLGEQLKDLDIGILVNNVGVAAKPYPQYLHESDPEMLYNMTEINSQSMVQMTKLVLPKMMEKKRGVIVNVSSGLAMQRLSVPMAVVYSASKCFTLTFSNCLHEEYASKGIIVQCVIPLYVATAMTAPGVKPSFFTPDGFTYARAAVATIGVQRLTFGCVSHALQGILLNNAPVFLMNRLTFSALKKQRASWYKELEKAKEE